MRNALRLVDRILLPAIPFLLGLWANLLSDQLAFIFLVLLPLVVIAFFFARRLIGRRLPPDWIVDLEPPKRLTSEAEQLRNARRGLVVLVSAYNPIRGPLAKLLPPEKAAAVQAAIAAEDLDALDLPNSNMDMVLRAVEAHKIRLEHLWLVATRSDDQTKAAGSDAILKCLRKYLAQRTQTQCAIHDEEQYRIDLKDDALVYSQVYDTVRNIFSEARTRYNLPPHEVIVDCTGGYKSMSLGGILASLGRTHDVQLTGAIYGSDGRPVAGSEFTMVYPFSPDSPEGT